MKSWRTWRLIALAGWALAAILFVAGRAPAEPRTFAECVERRGATAATDIGARAMHALCRDQFPDFSGQATPVSPRER